MQLITGNTYPVKEALKALGATWNKPAKGWNVPDEMAEKAKAIVAAAGPATPYEPSHRGRESRRSSRYRSTYTRFAGGGEHYVNKNGRCEDAPCCGCCS